jgi:hypothetical protein
MTRSKVLRLLLPFAFGLAGCIVVVEVPTTLTPPPIPTSTFPAAATAAPSPTALEFPAATLSPMPSSTPIPITPLHTPFPTFTSVGPSVPISITSFTIAPAEIRPGDFITLTWNVSAEQVMIYRLNALGQLSDQYAEPISGTLVLLTDASLRNHIDFMLNASSGGSSAQAFVSAKITCPDVWFFANPPAECPVSPHTTVMVAEHFEHGLMLWTQWNDVIYILYSDTVFSPRWDARPNAWFSGMPESDSTLTPPAGFYQPVRGFGVAWRDEQTPAGARARDRLGWATDQEFQVGNAAYQCNAAPKYNTCYITGPGSVVYVLQPERSGWTVWGGPTPGP